MEEEMIYDRPVLDLLTMFDGGAKKGFLTRLCYYSFLASENDIRAKYPTLEHLRRQVISSETVQDSIQETLGLKEGNSDIQQELLLENKLKEKTINFANDMIGTVTSRVIRFCGWLYLSLLKQICDSVQFSTAQMQSIQEVAKTGIPLIYMPLHFSHLDYILVSLVLFHNRIRVPYIASGNNLHIPIFSYFIKRAGGFFIRRKLESDNQKDLIYRAVLQTYVTELLKDGQSIEIFLEGTRSRSGLPNFPKTGLLSLLVDAVVSGQVQDALLVPVSISYEKLFEGNFNCELMGKPKLRENLWNTIKSITKMLCGSYGGIRINFAKPISIKAALSDISLYSSGKNLPYSSQGSNGSETGSTSDMASVVVNSPCQDQTWRKNVSLLAEHIVYHGLRCRSFMSTNLVAFLLMNKWRGGVQLEDLVASFTHLKAELIARGRDVGFCGFDHDIVLHALNILGSNAVSIEYCTKRKETVNRQFPDLEYVGGAGDAVSTLTESDTDSDRSITPVNIYDDNSDSGVDISCCHHESLEKGQQTSVKIQEIPNLLITPIMDVPEVFELAYYSNALVPEFALESIVCLSVTAMTGYRFSTIARHWELKNTEIYEDCLSERVRSSFLKSALLDKALELCDFLQIDLILCDVMEDLENGIKEKIHDLVTCGVFSSEAFGNTKNTHMAYGLDEEETRSEDQWLKVNPSSISRLLCYQSVLAPIVEGLAIVTEHLKVLEDPMPEKQFLARLLSFACERSVDGLATRVECCSRDILSQCVRAFKYNQVVEVRDNQLSLCCGFAKPDILDHLRSKICSYLM